MRHNDSVAFSPRLLVIVVALAALPACTKVKARTPDPEPGLAIPTAPDRMIVPVTLPEPVEPPPAPAPSPPAPSRPTTARPERSTPAQAATPPAVPTAEVAPPQPPPVLQTTSNPAGLEQETRALIGTAQRDLERVPVAQLSVNARSQYDRARGFIRQAEDALRIKNVVLARELADKAASLASQLPKK